MQAVEAGVRNAYLALSPARAPVWQTLCYSVKDSYFCVISLFLLMTFISLFLLMTFVSLFLLMTFISLFLLTTSILFSCQRAL